MKTLATMIVIGMLLIAAPASADTCEVEGEVGLTTAWGECMTPSLYDEYYSFENLSATPSIISGQEDVSIAELYGVEDDTPSDRQLGGGLLENTRSFNEILWWGITGPPGPR